MWHWWNVVFIDVMKCYVMKSIESTKCAFNNSKVQLIFEYSNNKIIW